MLIPCTSFSFGVVHVCLLKQGVLLLCMLVFSGWEQCLYRVDHDYFMFSVSLLLAFHHVHLHHPYSILHFEQCWLASWKVGELNLCSEGIGAVSLTCNTHLGKSDVFVWGKKPCGCSYINLHPVLCAVCVPTSFLSAKQIPPWTGVVLLLLLNTNGQALVYTAGVILWHLLPGKQGLLHLPFPCAPAPFLCCCFCDQEDSVGSRWSWKVTPHQNTDF